MQRVFVLDSHRNPLMPCHPARARELLDKGKAAVYRRYPFTIILTDREGGEVQPTAFKIDPGSKTTGLAVIAVFKRGTRLIWAAELTHRGQQIKEALQSRRQIRRSRRQRHTRYRPARFDNRRRPDGWLPPSIKSRVDNITTWANKIAAQCPISQVSMELVKFDTQKMQNAEISGVEYQQGELMGYEVREYLLEKWGRKCAYCGIQNVPLEVEHIVPRVRTGSNRVSNLTLACHACNIAKGTQTAAEFGYPHIHAKAKQPLKDAAAINSSRWALYRIFADSGCPVEVGSGGRTKYNRTRQHYPKTHWLDAACVGESGERVFFQQGHQPLLIAASGRGSRQMCKMDKYGFPRTSAKSKKRVRGFQTGDMVKAIVTTGKKVGTYVGRVAIRTSGSFNIKPQHDIVQGISWRCCRLLQRMDGYTYQKGDPCAFLPTSKDGGFSRKI
jgi:5-methylcytosine-specific restriction endonuclease McrA